MLIVMPVAIKAHLHNLCVKNNYEQHLQTRSTNRSQLRMRGPQKHLIHCPQKREREIFKSSPPPLQQHLFCEAVFIENPQINN